VTRPPEGLYVSRRIKESCMDGGREEAVMQDPRQMSEARKKNDS
jgi:hypothetical protein